MANFNVVNDEENKTWFCIPPTQEDLPSVPGRYMGQIQEIHKHFITSNADPTRFKIFLITGGKKETRSLLVYYYCLKFSAIYCCKCMYVDAAKLIAEAKDFESKTGVDLIEAFLEEDENSFTLLIFDNFTNDEANAM